MFGSSGKTTLLLIGRDRLVRCDVSPGSGKSLGMWQGPRPAREELPALVELALRLGGGRPGKVWVLTSDIWTQTVTMSRDAVTGISNEETARLLAFEAESLSGTSALESEVGFVQISGEGSTRDFRIVQISTWMREQLDLVITSAKGTFGGVTHPGGMPEALSASASGTWLRMELWPGALVGIARDASGSLRQYVNHADLRGTGWKGSWDAWVTAVGGMPPTEVLIDAGLILPVIMASSSNVARRLDDEQTLTEWLTRWAQALHRDSKKIPFIAPIKRPMSSTTRGLISVGLGAAVLVAALVDRAMLTSDMAKMKAETAQKKEGTAQLEAFRTQATTIQKQIADSKKTLEKFEKDTQGVVVSLAAHRARWAFLLAAISRVSPNDLAVLEIKESGGKVQIHGACLGPHPANIFATNLSDELAPWGWHVSPPQKAFGMTTLSNDPWRFFLELLETTPSMPETPPVWDPAPADKGKEQLVIQPRKMAEPTAGESNFIAREELAP